MTNKQKNLSSASLLQTEETSPQHQPAAGQDQPNHRQQAQQAATLIKDSPAPSEEPSEEASEWYYDKNIKGDGQKPAWFNEQKYKTISEQAKAQRELEQKLGQTQRAPNKYTLHYPPEFPAELRFDDDDPYFISLQEKAKKHNITNELFNEIYVQNELQKIKIDQQIKQKELLKLGPNAKGRLQKINNWAKNNLSPNQTIALKMASQSAEIIELIETFINKDKERFVPSQLKGSAEGLSEQSLQKRVADPRYKSDPKFREQTKKLFEQYYDTPPELF